MNRGTVVCLSTLLLSSAALAGPSALPAAADHAPLFALEIFEPEAGEVPDPRCGDTSRGVQPPADADLPADTVPVAVIQGSLPRGAASVDRCRFRVRFGTGSLVVYNSAETRVSKRALLRSGVRVVAMRDEQTGVLVAEKVAGRATARNEVERAYLATVDVTTRGAGEWTTTETGGTGRTFTFDVTAAEDETVGEASPVAIEFDTVAPVPD
jgi:hypothetical protein